MIKSSEEVYEQFEKQANALKNSLNRLGRSVRDFKENRSALNSLVEEQVRDADLLKVTPGFNQEMFNVMNERQKQIDSLKKDVALGSGVRHALPTALGTAGAIGAGRTLAKKKTQMNQVDEEIMKQTEAGTVYEK